MVMFQAEDKWSRLGMDYSSIGHERLLKNPYLQKNILARNLSCFLVHVSLTYETRCSPASTQICHQTSTKPLIIQWLGNYCIARSMKCSVISHSCLKKPLCCCQIVCGDIKTNSEFSAKKLDWAPLLIENNSVSGLQIWAILPLCLCQ